MIEDPFAARALQVHNEAGFGPKRASVARALDGVDVSAYFGPVSREEVLEVVVG